MKVIHTKTQEEYDRLMDIYENKGWKWYTGHNPKEFNGYLYNRTSTCIEYANTFGYGYILVYEKQGDDIISFQEFLELEGLAFKRGDIVIDKDGDEIEFICDLLEEDKSGRRYVIKYKGGYSFSKFLKKKEKKVELTLEEIADKFNIDINHLKIKK